MFTLGKGCVRTCSGTTRRDFLRVGGLGALGLGLSELDLAHADEPAALDRAVILLMLVGGPSQLETWDPKPNAPAEVRGPFGSIATSVPGVRICEHLPRLARRMDRLTLIRSLHHDAAPIHETGHQLIQTGKLSLTDKDYPHVGSVVARLQGSRNDLPPFVLLPGPIANTGVGISHGQTAGALGSAFDPFHLAVDPGSGFDAAEAFDRAQRFLDTATELPPRVRSTADRVFARTSRRAFDLAAESPAACERYGRSTFGQSCLLARRLVEAGVRLVTVNMFDTVFNEVTWDCHGARPFSTLDDYARTLLPTFDQAFSALVDDLAARGMLDSTLVVATGEFGRTPRLNAAGGRDHWPGVWSAAMAGGDLRPGEVIGASDAHAAEPADRPVTPPELLATIYRSLGLDPSLSIALGDGEPMVLAQGAQPIAEAIG